MLAQTAADQTPPEIEFSVGTDSTGHTQVTATSFYHDGVVSREFTIQPADGVCEVTITIQFGTEDASTYTSQYAVASYSLPWIEPLGTELIHVTELESVPTTLRIRDFAYNQQFSSQFADYAYLTTDATPDVQSSRTNGSQPPQQATDCHVVLRYEQSQSQWRAVGMLETESQSHVIVYERTSDSIDVYRDDSLIETYPVVGTQVQLQNQRLHRRTIPQSEIPVGVSRFVWYHLFERLPMDLPYRTTQPSVSPSPITNVFSQDA